MNFGAWLQTRLIAHGFNPGKIDGNVGPKTLEALRAFERARGFPVDGTADNFVVDALRRDPPNDGPEQTARLVSANDREKLKGVHPDLARVYARFVETFKADFDVRITQGVRTLEEQRRNVARGVSKTMKSRHIPASNRSRLAEAIDLAPFFAGSPKWDWPYFHQIAAGMKAAAKLENVPIVWGGDWKSFKDGPHFELRRKEYPA